MLSLKEFVDNEHTMIVAHRGASSTSPENTISAFREALTAGVNFIECDIQITKDEKIVVYHDTIPNNYKRAVKDIPYEELDFKRINPNVDEKYQHEQIPLLKDLLELVQNKAYIVIELKIIDDDNYQKIIDKTIDIVNAYNYADKTLFASFHYDTIKRIKEINSDLHTAVIKMPQDNRLPSELLEICDFDAYICHISELNPYIDNDAKKSNIFVGVYTVDNDEDLEKIKDYQVLAYGTNNPAWLVNKLNLK